MRHIFELCHSEDQVLWSKIDEEEILLFFIYFPVSESYNTLDWERCESTNISTSCFSPDWVVRAAETGTEY